MLEGAPRSEFQTPRGSGLEEWKVFENTLRSVVLQKEFCVEVQLVVGKLCSSTTTRRSRGMESMAQCWPTCQVLRTIKRAEPCLHHGIGKLDRSLHHPYGQYGHN